MLAAVLTRTETPSLCRDSLCVRPCVRLYNSVGDGGTMRLGLCVFKVMVKYSSMIMAVVVPARVCP